MVNKNEFLYGHYYAQFAKRNSSGFPVGQVADPETLADGIVFPALVLRNPTEFVPPAPTFTNVVDQGGQKIRSQALVGMESPGTATFTPSELNDIFTTMINNTTIDSTTVTGWDQIAENFNNTNFPAMFAMFTTRLQELDDDADTIVDKFKTWVIANAQISNTQNPTATQAGGTNPQLPQYTLTPRPSKTRLTGDTFKAAGMNVEDDKDYIYSIRSSNALTQATYTVKAIPDGSFTLPFLPLTDETVVTDKLFYNATTGAAIVPTTVTVATGAVVLPIIGLTQSDIISCVWETAFNTP
jgi:hypothetical protein